LELQDFDQVFIKLFEERRAGGELIAGDFVLQRPKSHFLTYLKKDEGPQLRHLLPAGARGPGARTHRLQRGRSARASSPAT
jgi:hypothetical protein